VARAEPITFHVPASAANLGSGYGVLALALDLPLGITIEPRSDGELVVARGDDPHAHRDDPRHDPVLRGLRSGAEALGVSLAKGFTVRVEGTIPRGAGLGTISASYAAGIGAAVRLHRQRASVSAMLDRIVPLGADPAHGAAALLGGLCATVPLTTPQAPVQHHHVQAHPIHPDWHCVVVLPDAQLGTAETKRVLPPTLPHGAAPRAVGRTLGILEALQRGDETLLRACLVDELHVPYRRRLLPGMSEALDAAMGAGAAGATICGHGPGLLALTRNSANGPGIAQAMVEAFTRAGRAATALQLGVAFYGALPPTL
jgi:homoserine kinase